MSDEQLWFRERVIAWAMVEAASESRPVYKGGQLIRMDRPEKPNLFLSMHLEPISLSAYDGPHEGTYDDDGITDREAVRISVIPEGRTIYRIGAISTDRQRVLWLGYEGADPECVIDWQEEARTAIARDSENAARAAKKAGRE